MDKICIILMTNRIECYLSSICYDLIQVGNRQGNHKLLKYPDMDGIINCSYSVLERLQP